MECHTFSLNHSDLAGNRVKHPRRPCSMHLILHVIAGSGSSLKEGDLQCTSKKEHPKNGDVRTKRTSPNRGCSDKKNIPKLGMFRQKEHPQIGDVLFGDVLFTGFLHTKEHPRFGDVLCERTSPTSSRAVGDEHPRFGGCSSA